MCKTSLKQRLNCW